MYTPLKVATTPRACSALGASPIAMQTTNPTWQRRNNLAVLARAVWQNPGLSRRDLDRRFQIDKSSISRLVQMLLDWGLVETAGRLESASEGLSAGGRVYYVDAGDCEQRDFQSGGVLRHILDNQNSTRHPIILPEFVPGESQFQC